MTDASTDPTIVRLREIDAEIKTPEEERCRLQNQRSPTPPPVGKPPPRDLCTVLRRILSVVPPGETKLRAQLNDVKSSADFAPPEGMRLWWRRAAEVLADAVEPHISAGDAWALQVRDIFVGQVP